MKTDQVDLLLQNAAAQQEQRQRAQMALMQALQVGLRSPHTIHRLNVCDVEITDDGNGGKALLFGSPSGERWEVLLTPRTRAKLAAALVADERASVSQAGDNGTSMALLDGDGSPHADAHLLGEDPA